MPDCAYCDEAFVSEDAYLDHLASEHDGELSRIDRRRVDEHTSAQGFDVPPTVIYAVAGVALLAVAVAGMYYVVTAFSAETTVHEHGSLEVTIDGQQIQFSQYERYTRPGGDPGADFHVHSGQSGYWHMHPEEPGRLTIAEAFAGWGVEITESRLEIEGETYDATQDGVELSITVNGDPVDPESYELHGVGGQPYDRGDDLRVVVQTSDASA